ncbi:MAG: thiol-disulfide oxidoreductase DCC family protein [bacterium]
MTNRDQTIVFFDSECVLCNGTLQWILRNEQYHTLCFAPLNGETALEIIGEIQQLPDSIIVAQDGNIFCKSEAIALILRHMGGIWRYVGGALGLIPFFISNSIYDIIARNRHKWFGKQSECLLMKGTNKHRFLK